jgi:hypothetical protein
MVVHRDEPEQMLHFTASLSRPLAILTRSRQVPTPMLPAYEYKPGTRRSKCHCAAWAPNSIGVLCPCV